MKMLRPIQVAYRGFEHELTVDWIYQRIARALEEGVLDKPKHRLPPGNFFITVHFNHSLVETWRFHYNRGDRVEIPRELWEEIDRLLGLRDAEAAGG